MSFKYVGAGLTDKAVAQTTNKTKPALTKSESFEMT